MSKHTPGPWECKRLIDKLGKPYATHYLAHIDIGPCMVWAPPGNAEQEANARLIAAAPELLKALESVLENCLNSEGLAAAYAKARAAIAKATGEQQ